jgi:hypothetical protein
MNIYSYKKEELIPKVQELFKDKVDFPNELGKLLEPVFPE